MGFRQAHTAAWPAVTEPLLRERQAMSDDEFFAFLAGLLEAIGTRALDDAHYERAIGYPWDRPGGSCLVTDGTVQELTSLDAQQRDALVARYAQDRERIALLAYGANGAPERLALKLAHLDEGHREALIIAGDLEDFDVGAAAQPPVFSSMPATLIPSPGTAVRVAVLFLTPVQFTALWWTELSYRVGALSDVTLTTDVAAVRVTRVLTFVSRFGAFAPDGTAVAMAALAARDRRAPALTQLEILDRAASLCLGSDACARDLVKAAYEGPAAFMAAHRPALRAASIPFASEHWMPMPAALMPSAAVPGSS